jgi:thiol:disulfide interchange protein DsbC
MSIKKLLLVCAIVSFFRPCLADGEKNIEAAIKQGVEARLGGQVASVTKTPYIGLYEVFRENDVLYTDENVTVLLAGPLIDATTMTNVTAERLQKLMAIDFSKLPLNLAIKQVRGNGKHVMATFEDPNCGFCKRLAKDVALLNNVTIYTFLYPILSPDSLEKSKLIWCSGNRAKAWNEWMLEGKKPEGKSDCDTSAVQKSSEIGRSLSITGVPTMFFSDGQRVSGILTVEKLQQKLFGAKGETGGKREKTAGR